MDRHAFMNGRIFLSISFVIVMVMTTACSDSKNKSSNKFLPLLAFPWGHDGGMSGDGDDDPVVDSGVQPEGALVINDNDIYTGSQNIDLDINVINADQMRFSNNDGLTWSEWEPYSESRTWTLDAGPGIKTVWGEFSNKTGGLKVIHDSIITLIEERISASNGTVDAFFGGLANGRNGIPVSVNGDGSVIVVGAPHNTVNSNAQQGSVYVYRWNGSSWSEVILTASDGAANHCFGFSTGISSNGTVIAVGAYLNNAAYVYRFNGSTWVETKIVQVFGAGEFGVSVDVSADGSTVCVGSHRVDGANSPYVSICRWSGSVWSQTKIAASDVSVIGYGISVSCSSDGNVVLVGSRYDNSNQGSAYIYRWNGSAWVEAKITAADGGELFGRSVAISDDGNTAVVGSHMKDISTNADQGAAYVYRYSEGSWTGVRITASDGHLNDQFGYSVDISSDGGSIIIGSHLDDIGANDSQGSAYLYRWNGSAWDENKKFTNSSGSVNDRFGYCSRISGDGATIAVSAPGDSGNKGIVFVY